MLLRHVAKTLQACSSREEFFGDWYDSFVEEHGREPGVIHVHLVIHRYGGPEEGGWYYDEGHPIENICIFSKDQAVRNLERLHSDYASEEKHPDEEYYISLGTRWAEVFPAVKPTYK